MSDYADLIGMIQFPIEPDKTANGQPIREAVIKAMNKDDKLVRCTVWPNFAHVPLKQGDFLSVGGKASTGQGKPKEDGTIVTYYNLSVIRLAVIESAVPVETERVFVSGADVF